jgi:hypothetical protein
VQYFEEPTSSILVLAVKNEIYRRCAAAVNGDFLLKSRIDAMGSSNTVSCSDYIATSDRNFFSSTKNWNI